MKKFIHWFGNYSEESVQQFVIDAPGKTYSDNYGERLGVVVSAERVYKEDYNRIKAVEVTIADFNEEVI